jgi:hypothetical protein
MPPPHSFASQIFCLTYVSKYATFLSITGFRAGRFSKEVIPPAKKSFAILTKSKSTVEDVVAIRPSRGFLCRHRALNFYSFDSRSSALRFELGFTLNMFLVAWDCASFFFLLFRNSFELRGEGGGFAEVKSGRGWMLQIATWIRKDLRAPSQQS